MRRFFLPAVLAAAGLASMSQAPAPQTFRAGVDLVQVDVSALDKARHPVRGLTAADFTLFEDGKPRPIVAFSAVDLPPRAAPGEAPWQRDISPDVATNAIPQEGRLVIIMLDRSTPDGWPTLNAQNIAKTAVNALGAGDLAAVVYTSGGGSFQGFTSDRDKLISAIDRTGPAGEASAAANEIWTGLLESMDNPAVYLNPNPGLAAMNFGTDCYCGACVLQAISRIADGVRDAGGRRRKTLLFIGRDIQVETVESACIDAVRKARDQMFRSLDLASLTVHSLDPGGLETPLTATPRPRGVLPFGHANLVSQGNIAVLPDRTGGRTVLNTNNPARRVQEIFAESDSYYLLGFPPAAADGQRHNISVKVDRRGLDVRTRRGYLAVDAGAVLPASPAASNAATAIKGLLPERSGVLMSAQITSVPLPATREPVLAIALHVRHDATSDAPLTSAPERVEVVTAVFSVNGRSVGTLRQTLDVRPQAAGREVTYDLLQRLPAKSGRYELRIGLTNQTRKQTGSVYAFIDVPDFRRELFSMSEIGVFAPMGGFAMSQDLADVLPAPPTARRDFGRDEQVQAFSRFYQGSGGPPASVFLTTKILDSQNRKRYGQDTSLPASAFSGGVTADYVADVPIADLEPGDYLLTIEAKAGVVSTRRDLKFSIREAL